MAKVSFPIHNYRKSCELMNLDVYSSQINSQNEELVLSTLKELDTLSKTGYAESIGKSKICSSIVACISHPNKEVRKHANWIIGNLAEHGEVETIVTQRVIKKIVHSLSDPYEWTRSSAAWVLSVISVHGKALDVVKAGGIRHLIGCLTDPDPIVRGCSSLALDKIAYCGFIQEIIESDGVSRLFQCINDSNKNVRMRSLWALWSITLRSDPKTAINGIKWENLEKTFRYTDNDTQYAALHLIAIIGRKGEISKFNHIELFSEILKNITSKNPHTRGAAALVVKEYIKDYSHDRGPYNQLLFLLSKLKKDENFFPVYNQNTDNWEKITIGSVVKEILQENNGENMLPFNSKDLIHILQNSKDEHERNKAAKYLGGYPSELVEDALLLTVERDPKVRYEALKSLKTLKSQKAMPKFIIRLRDPSARIRKVSILALAEISSKDAIDPLNEIIRTHDYANFNQNRPGRGGRKNWGKEENVVLAKEAIRRIKNTEESPSYQPSKPNISEDKNRRYVTLGDVKQYEMIFTGKIENQIEKRGKTIIFNNERYYLEDKSIVAGYDIRRIKRQLPYTDYNNLPENTQIIAKYSTRAFISPRHCFFIAKFLSRPQTFAEYGKDTYPISIMELNRDIRYFIKYAQNEKMEGCLCIGSPTGFDEDAIKYFNSEESHLNFYSKELSVCLLDIETAQIYHNENDERLSAFLHLCSLQIDAEKIRKIKPKLDEIFDVCLKPSEYIPLSCVVKECQNAGFKDLTLVKIAIHQHVEEKKYYVKNITEVGIVFLPNN